MVATDRVVTHSSRSDTRDDMHIDPLPCTALHCPALSCLLLPSPALVENGGGWGQATLLTEVWECRPDHSRARQGRAEHSRGRHDPTDMHKTGAKGSSMQAAPSTTSQAKPTTGNQHTTNNPYNAAPQDNAMCFLFCSPEATDSLITLSRYGVTLHGTDVMQSCVTCTGML